MNPQLRISQLIAQKIAGTASEKELKEWNQLIAEYPELEQPLGVIVNLWNSPGPQSQREVDNAFRKVSDSIWLKKETERKTRNKFESRIFSRICSFVC